MKKKINNPTKFFYKIFILAFIFTNIFITDSFSKSGKGSLKLSKYTMEHLMMYMYGAGNTKYSIEKKKRSEPTVIAISKDGNYSSYFYCPYESGCNDTGVYWQAIKKCEKGSNGSPCFVFAKKRKIVWKNGINKKTRISKKTLKNPVQVAKIIKDLGFYDGDIYQLAGIDQTTGQVKVDKKITGETDNFDYPSLINTLSSKQKNSWKEYVQGGNEKYKVWVMAKRNDGNYSWRWEAYNTSFKDVLEKSFRKCDAYIKEYPNTYKKSAICILYYKGTTPTSDKEKIETAINYYGKEKAEKFFKSNSYILNNKDLANNLSSGSTKESITDEKSSKKVVEQLKTLNDLLKSGALTKEEFERTKKMILEN